MAKRLAIELPSSDNTPAALAALKTANAQYRQIPWPEPFDRTSHTLRLSDARNLRWIPSESVHLVVTSPPYWTLKDYNRKGSGYRSASPIQKALSMLTKAEM
jgi:site-specific DNA-methyltransferase (adenine-specific)